ncbi:hypothetical protein FJY69_07245, partial [candidate division WOR-3 bacterium]|nr:hypothetical protein [candidate division WOR-3 bacterium]
MLRIRMILALGITLGSVWATPPFDWPTYNRDSVHSGQIPVVPMGRCSLAWTYDPGLSSFNGSENGSMVATESSVVYATSDGRVQCINAQTGARRWRSAVYGPAGQQAGTPIIFADSVVACAFGISSGWHVRFLRLSTGASLGSHSITASAVESDPIILTTNNIPTFYAGQADGMVVGINMLTRGQRYRRQVSSGPVRGAIATDGTQLYVVSSDSGLSKWAPDLTLVWRMARTVNFNYNCRSGATYCNGRVFFGTDSGSGRLFAVRSSDGGRAWTSGQIGLMAFGIPSTFDTTLVFIGTQTCSVIALRQRDGLRTSPGWGRLLRAGAVNRAV